MTTQAMGAETLVYDERRHMAFCLNTCSSVVWQLADGERTVAEIAEQASRKLGAEISGEMVRFALEELRESGLMEADAECPALPLNTNPSEVETSSRTGSDRVRSRRAMLARLGAAALLPVVASIFAPTAAQAYSGCVDCLATPARRRPLRAVPRN